MDIDAEADSILGELLPEKSVDRYKKSLKDFRNWMSANGLDKISENAVLVYLKQKSTTLAPNSLFSLFSMLKTGLPKEKLETFNQVQAYLKKINKNYKPKKSLSFASEDFHGFILRAPDIQYLLHKVVLILGISGAMRGNEIFVLKSTDIMDKEEYIQVEVKDTKNNLDRKFVVVNSESLKFADIIRKYSAMRPLQRADPRFLFSYANGKGINNPVGINKVRIIPSEAA